MALRVHVVKRCSRNLLSADRDNNPSGTIINALPPCFRELMIHSKANPSKPLPDIGYKHDFPFSSISFFIALTPLVTYGGLVNIRSNVSFYQCQMSPNSF